MTSYVSAGDLGPSGMPPELSAAVAMASVGSLARTSEGPAVAVPPWEPLEYAFSQASLASASDSRPLGATEGIAIMEMALVRLLRPGIASARTSDEPLLYPVSPMLTAPPACSRAVSRDSAVAVPPRGTSEYAVFRASLAPSGEDGPSGALAVLSAVLERAPSGLLRPGITSARKSEGPL